MPNRPIHFEIQAHDTERAIKFYTDVFGWEFKKWEGSPVDYWMVLTAPMDSKEPGINGGLLKSPAAQPPEHCGTNAFVCTMKVDDFDATAEKILAAGGKVAMPKFDLGGMAWQGYFLDTEGNTIGLHEVTKKAS